jgi:hypothetical protein
MPSIIIPHTKQRETAHPSREPHTLEKHRRRGERAPGPCTRRGTGRRRRRSRAKWCRPPARPRPHRAAPARGAGGATTPRCRGPCRKGSPLEKPTGNQRRQPNHQNQNQITGKGKESPPPPEAGCGSHLRIGIPRGWGAGVTEGGRGDSDLGVVGEWGTGSVRVPCRCSARRGGLAATVKPVGTLIFV